MLRVFFIPVCVVVATLASPLARAGDAVARKLSDVVRVTTTAEQALRVEWLPLVEPPLRPMALVGPEARWNVRGPRPTGGVVPGTVELERPPARTRDPSASWFVFVSASPAHVSITAHRGGRVAHATTLRFEQSADGAAHLVVQDNAANTIAQARAANVVELRAAHPRLVRECLVPVLVQLAGHDPLLPGATDVYRVFEELGQDEAAERSVRVLLPELTDRSFARREEASRRLDTLGAPAVCAVLRMRVDDLMPEQKVRLENFLTAHSHRAIDDPRAARRDLAFLADCLEFAGDDRVNHAARREIEQITGKQIPLHPAPTRAEWTNAADVLRRQILESGGR